MSESFNYSKAEYFTRSLLYRLSFWRACSLAPFASADETATQQVFPSAGRRC